MINPETQYPELATMKNSEMLIIALVLVTDLLIEKVETRVILPKKNYDSYIKEMKSVYGCDEIYLHTIQK